MTSTIYDTLGFNDNPFPPGACRDHYFQTETTNRILEVLHYGIKSHKGFLVFIGEVGLGKTSLLLQLLPLLEADNVRTSWVFNTAVDKYELLQTLVQDYGIKLPETPHLSTLIDSLHNFFLSEHRAGHNCSIIIDEAHNLDFQCMEALRMLSNLELNGEKLVQILLTGQPELKSKLDQPEMRQLTSRINVFLTLPTLNSEEIGQYVNFKLTAVGSQLYLEEKAHKLLCQVSGGNLRMINLLMEKTMYAMVALGERRVSRRTVYEGVKDVGAWNKNVARSLRRVTMRQFSLYAGIGAVSVLLIAALVYLVVPGTRDDDVLPPVAETSRPAAHAAASESDAPSAAQNDSNAIEETNSDSDPIILDTAPSVSGGASLQASGEHDAAPKGPAHPPQPTAENELLKASAEFLAPWGLNYLAVPLRKAVQEKELDSFILSLPTDKPAAKNLRLVPLRERPPEGSIRVTYFPWRRFTGTGDNWIALWQPPVEITRFTRGYSGDEIRELQKRLQFFGFYSMGLDGKVGPGTIRALMDFQKSRGLSASGTPDQQTLLWLYQDNPEGDLSLQGEESHAGDYDPSTPPPEPEKNPFNLVPKKTSPSPPPRKKARSEELEFTPGNQIPKRQQPNTVRIRPNTTTSAPAQTKPVIKRPRNIPNTNQ